jgi:predicted DNA-binding transcriptional regulator AlpA
MEKVLMSQAKVDNQPQRWLRSKHVRELLGISDSTLMSLRVKGIIPAYRLGDSWFYKESEILDALEGGRNK